MHLIDLCSICVTFKLQIFLTQTRNEPVGITIGGLIMIDPTSVVTVSGRKLSILK